MPNVFLEGTVLSKAKEDTKKTKYYLTRSRLTSSNVLTSRSSSISLYLILLVLVSFQTIRCLCFNRISKSTRVLQNSGREKCFKPPDFTNTDSIMKRKILSQSSSIFYHGEYKNWMWAFVLNSSRRGGRTSKDSYNRKANFYSSPFTLFPTEKRKVLKTENIIIDLDASQYKIKNLNQGTYSNRIKSTKLYQSNDDYDLKTKNSSSFEGSSSTSTKKSKSSGSPRFTNRQNDNNFLLALRNRIISKGPKLFQETVSIVRDAGLQAGFRRTLQATQAFAATLLELRKEISQYQQQQQMQQSSSSSVQPNEILSTRTFAKTLRMLFERLGATYIKLGQFIASSPTLFPEEFVLEFQNCLDKTTPLPFEDIKRIISANIGGNRNVEDIFEYIDPTPLASASIAQVYLGKLKKNGKEVAIKVQKPGVTDILKTDLGFLYIVSRLLEILTPELERTSFSDIMFDLKNSILDEVDFRKEANNIEEFQMFLAQAGITNVVAPQVYREYSSEKVLVMERLRGKSLIDLESVKEYSNDPEGTLISALNTWILSVAMCPSFHADVHAGNLLILEDGKVGFIDFGIVGRVPKNIWGSLNDILEGVVTLDYATMANGLIGMGATSEEVDRVKLSEDLKDLFQSLTNIEPTVRVDVGIDPLSGQQVATNAEVAIDEESITQVLVDLVKVTNDNGLKLPREFGLLIKQVLYFDRYTKLLAPDLDNPFTDARIAESLQTYRSSSDEGPVIEYIPPPN